MNEQGLKDRLQAISKERGIPFNECWKKLLLERFLSRLSRSTYTQQFIFKGAKTSREHSRCHYGNQQNA